MGKKIDEQTFEFALGAVQSKTDFISKMSISSKEGAVVMFDENEWSNIKESLQLLSDKESLAALLESHVIRERGEKSEGVTPEETFKDV